MTDIPPEAATAAAEAAVAKALHRLFLKVPCPEDDEFARAAVKAAAPLITAIATAAERERIIQYAIAEADRVHASGNWRDQARALRRFADLIAGDTP